MFSSDHPKIRKHLANQAGVADEAWNQAAPEDQRLALARCRFLELVEASSRRTISPRIGWKQAYATACANFGPEVLGHTVSVPTFYEWRRKYLGAGRRRSALMDRRGKSDRTSGTFDSRAWAYFEGLYLARPPRSVKNCWTQTAAKADQVGWHWPAYKVVCRRVAMEFPPQVADFYRLGERAWTMRHAPKLTIDTSDLAGNHTWVIDHLRHDFWARIGRQRKRLWCSLITDRASAVFG